jgi:Domain of unknown function (DUF1918)
MALHASEHGGRLWARSGDRLVIRAHSLGEPDRDAEILEPLGEGGAPPFRVCWQDDGHVSEIFPGADAYVEHFAPTDTDESEASTQ